MKSRPYSIAGRFAWIGSLAPALAQDAPPAEDIRGAKPPIPIPGPPPPTPWLMYGLIVLGVGVAIGLVIWFLKRRPGAVPAEKQARLELDRLSREGERLPATEFATAASGIVRVFIERRFGLAAPKRTTEEFLKELAARPDQSLHPRLEALRAFLKACDQAKFAAADLEAAQREELVVRAREVVATPLAPELRSSTPS